MRETAMLALRGKPSPRASTSHLLSQTMATPAGRAPAVARSFSSTPRPAMRMVGVQPLLRTPLNSRALSLPPSVLRISGVSPLVRSTQPSTARYASTSSSSSSSSSSSEEDSGPSGNPSFRQRMRYLWKRYGWWAFGVYNLWSLADFSLAWAVIHLFGADYIRDVETKVREAVGLKERDTADEELAVWPLPGQTPAVVEGVLGGPGAAKGGNNEEAAKLAADTLTKGSDEATAAAGASASQKSKGGSSTLWTEAVLAYTIHKTLLLPFRVMGTGALTPSFVVSMNAVTASMTSWPTTSLTRILISPGPLLLLLAETHGSTGMG